MNLSPVDFTCIVFRQVLIDQPHICSPKKLVRLAAFRCLARLPPALACDYPPRLIHLLCSTLNPNSSKRNHDPWY